MVVAASPLQLVAKIGKVAQDWPRIPPGGWSGWAWPKEDCESGRGGPRVTNVGGGEGGRRGRRGEWGVEGWRGGEMQGAWFG